MSLNDCVLCLKGGLLTLGAATPGSHFQLLLPFQEAPAALWARSRIKCPILLGQARSYYNIGPLSSSVNSTSFQESYSEFVGGYCITAMPNWTITPYAGLGFDFLFDDRTGYASIAPIDLKYTVYYAIAGFETHYAWQNWKLGLQFDCLPTFNQYLKIGGLSGAAWTLKNRVGAEVQVPFAYRYARNYWLEFAPYYRFFPFGTSSVLKLPERDLSQWGAFVTFRFFL